MRDHAITAIISILTLIIGALLGYYLDTFKDAKKNQLQYLDIRTVSNKDVLRKLSTKNNGEVNLTWGENVIDSVSKITIDVYNFSDKDFDNIPLYIDLSTNDNSKLEIIDIQGENESGIESHKIIKGYPKSHSQKSVRYGINLDIVNRSNTYDPSYRISFLIKGSNIPTVLAKVNKKGIKSQEFSRFKFDDKSLLEKYLPFIIIGFFTIAYAWLLVFLIKHGRKKTLKRYRETIPYLTEKLSDINFSESSNDDIAKLFVHYFRVIRWEKLSKLDKLIFETDRPKIEELDEELTSQSNRTQ